MKRSTRSGWTVVRWIDLAFGIAIAGALSPAHAAVVDVADCGALAAGDPASRVRVVADLECPGAVLALAKGGMLELGDHALRGVAVHCLDSCRVVGPGTIDAGGIVGEGRVLLRRVTVARSPADGVVARNHGGTARVTLVDSVVTGSAGNGVEFDRRATILRSQVVGNGRHGIVVSRREGNDCMRGRVSAKGSTFTGNGRDGDCGEAEVCADVATCSTREAQLAASSCGHSRQLGSGMPGGSCGVCDFD